MFFSKYIQQDKTIGYCGTNNVNRLYNCSRGKRPINRSAEHEESNTESDRGTTISTTSATHEIIITESYILVTCCASRDMADAEIPETSS